jgi:hypothetical protein
MTSVSRRCPAVPRPSVVQRGAFGASRRGARRPGAVTIALALLASVPVAFPAHACPDCAAGRQARHEVWSDDFGFNLVVALLPFLVIGAICVWVERSRRP